MLEASVAAAAVVALMWAFTPALAVTLVLFADQRGRSSQAGRWQAPCTGSRSPETWGATSARPRAVTTQLGYLIGSLAGARRSPSAASGCSGLALGGLVPRLHAAVRRSPPPGSPLAPPRGRAGPGAEAGGR